MGADREAREAAVRDAVRLHFWKDGSGGFTREFYGSTAVMVRGRSL